MKWFSWLFNFFSKPLEKSVVVGTIHLHDMEDWLALEKHHLISKYKLNSEIISYTNRLKDKRWELECKLDEWQQKIPLGKRDDVNYFFVETRKFLDEISFTEELEVDTVMQMNRKLEPMLIELIASIEEDDFATHFSFLSDGTDSTSEYDNLNPLLKELRVLNDSLTKFEQKITTTGIKTLENIEKKVEQLEGYTEQMHKQQKKFKLMKDRLQTAEAIKEEKESELIKLKQEENYKEISHLEKQREYLRKERDKLDDEVFSFFSRLKFILEKYLELQPHNLQVSSYIEDPVSAFLLDEGLGILHNLEHLKALLQQEKIKISPDELKQVSELLEKAHKGYLEQLHRQLFSFHQELEGGLVPLKNRDFIMKVEEAKYRVEHFLRQMEELQEKVSELEEEMESLAEKRNRDLELLQNMIKMGLGREVIIKLPVL